MKSKGAELHLWKNFQLIPLTTTQDGRWAGSYTVKLLLFQMGTREDLGQYFR